MEFDVLIEEDVEFLTSLVETPTVCPIEIHGSTEICRAQDSYARYAKKYGFEIVYREPAPRSALAGMLIPLAVRTAAERIGSDFFDCQPNMVLRLGPKREPMDTLMFNFHIDTVGGVVPVCRKGNLLFGRGAVDMKGSAVAILAGMRKSLERNPQLANRMSVLIQCVSGEECGAMGVYGTRVLMAEGYYGRLNVFAEPTSGVYFDHASSAMTALIEVNGTGSTDDFPGQGTNATVILGFLAQYLGEQLDAQVVSAGGKMCIGGLCTGDMHNRVYGTGKLLINFSYLNNKVGSQIEKWVAEALVGGFEQFSKTFLSSPSLLRSTQEISAVCRLSWTKRGLPVLANRDTEYESLLMSIGWQRSSDMERSFTCDAIWASGDDQYTIVYGPGDLGRNGAHTDHEFVDLHDLDQYASQVADLVTVFQSHLESVR